MAANTSGVRPDAQYELATSLMSDTRIYNGTVSSTIDSFISSMSWRYVCISPVASKRALATLQIARAFSTEETFFCSMRASNFSTAPVKSPPRDASVMGFVRASAGKMRATRPNFTAAYTSAAPIRRAASAYVRALLLEFICVCQLPSQLSQPSQVALSLSLLESHDVTSADALSAKYMSELSDWAC